MTLITNEQNMMAPVSDDVKQLILLGLKIKEYQDAYNQGLEKLKDFMEEHSIKKFENDDVVLTYIEPTYRETFDSKMFKKEHEDMYNEYIKISNIKSSLRVKLKGQN